MKEQRNLREYVFKEMLGGLRRLMVLTPGLIAIVAEEVGKKLGEKLEADSEPLCAAMRLLSLLEVQATIDLRDYLEVSVSVPCPLSFTDDCEDYCILPRLLSSYLEGSTGQRWIPLRMNTGFIRRTNGKCILRLVRGRTSLRREEK